MNNPVPTPAWQRSLVILTSTVLGVVVIGCLYWAQSILIPIVLAVLLTFILSPLVNSLGRWGVGRSPAAILMVAITALVLCGTLWLFTSQITGLVGELPKYSANIKQRARTLRRFADNAATERLERMISDIGDEIKRPPAGDAGAAPAADNSRTIIVEPKSSDMLSWVPALLGSLVEPLGGLVLALVLAVFMLVRREELRNRVIRLLGHGRVTMTTKAVDDAGQRISRFLFAQAVVNGSVGLVIGIGLEAIGMEYAFMWGFLAGMMRYLPYVGIWLAAAPPLLLSLGMFSGWIQPSLVAALFLAVELLTGNFLEPRLYGQSIGVSEVALLIVAACWAFLWGPIGLVFSGPLTVCLVVLGKYVPHLKFLDILLGDEPALDPEVSYYQRLLAGDQDEATELALASAKKSPDNVCDLLLLPALIRARHDLEHNLLSEVEEQFVVRATSEILDEIAELRAAAPQANPQSAAANGLADRRVKLVGCPARGRADSLALEMLSRALDPALWEVEILSDRLLSAEMVELAVSQAPDIICIASLPPGGLSRGRHLCRRLHKRLPQTRIVVGRWGASDDSESKRELLHEVGAAQVDMTLAETSKHLAAFWPALVHRDSSRPAGNEASVAAS